MTPPQAWAAVHWDTMIPAEDLHTALRQRLVKRTPHPLLPLVMFTYTKTAQYANAWNPATIRCRGLIVEETTGRVVAWPFPKMFAAELHSAGLPHIPPLPDEPFDVFDKVDGSLIIVFHYEGRWRAATKGAFVGGPVDRAAAYLRTRDTARLDPGVTYLAEYIAPWNRIVVDYGDREDLVLLGGYDVATGREIDLDRLAGQWRTIGSRVRFWDSYGPSALARLAALAAENRTPDGQEHRGTAAEGLIVRYRSGVRAKVKLADYLRCHHAMTGITARDLWRAMGLDFFVGRWPAKVVARALRCSPAEALDAAGFHSALEQLRDALPDEFGAWYQDTCEDIGRHWLQQKLLWLLQAEHTARALNLAHVAHDRQAFGRAIAHLPNPLRDVLVLLWDGHSIDLMAWAAVRPAPHTRRCLTLEG